MPGLKPLIGDSGERKKKSSYTKLSSSRSENEDYQDSDNRKRTSGQTNNKEKKTTKERGKNKLRAILIAIAGFFGFSGAFVGGKIGYALGERAGEERVYTMMEQGKSFENINQDNMPKQVAQLINPAENNSLFVQLLYGEKSCDELDFSEIPQVAEEALTVAKAVEYAKHTDENFDPKSLKAKEGDGQYSITDKDNPENTAAVVKGDDYKAFNKIATFNYQLTEDNSKRSLPELQCITEYCLRDLYAYLMDNYGRQESQLGENDVMVPYVDGKDTTIKKFRLSIQQPQGKGQNEQGKHDARIEKIAEEAMERTVKENNAKQLSNSGNNNIGDGRT